MSLLPLPCLLQGCVTCYFGPFAAWPFPAVMLLLVEYIIPHHRERKEEEKESEKGISNEAECADL